MNPGGYEGFDAYLYPVDNIEGDFFQHYVVENIFYWIKHTRITILSRFNGFGEELYATQVAHENERLVNRYC